MAGQINPEEQEETWALLIVCKVLSMIGPLFGGLITQFTNSLNNAFYFSAIVFLFLAFFYGTFFVKSNKHTIKRYCMMTRLHHTVSFIHIV